VVCHAVVEAEGSFDLFGAGNPGSDGVDLSPDIVLSAYSSRIRVVDKTVALLGGMQVRRPDAWVELKALLVWLLGVLVNAVSLVKRKRSLSLAVSLLHLFRARFYVIAGVNDAPSDARVPRR